MRNKPAIALLLALALLTAAATAGCGGDEDSASTAVSPTPAASLDEEISPAKEGFIDKAEDICAKGVEEGLQALADEVGPSQSSPSVRGKQVKAEAIRRLFLPSIQTMVDELDQLDPPPAEGQRFDAIVKAMQAGIEQSKEADGKLAAVEDFGESFHPANRLAVEYGLRFCVVG